MSQTDNKQGSRITSVSAAPSRMEPSERVTINRPTTNPFAAATLRTRKSIFCGRWRLEKTNNFQRFPLHSKGKGNVVNIVVDHTLLEEEARILIVDISETNNKD
jgi:hypothetical protein